MNDYFLTGEQVARMLGVSRKTVYRWADEGRIPPAYAWRQSTIAPLVGTVERPRKGPPRNPYAVRYTTGRHSFYEVRGKR